MQDWRDALVRQAAAEYQAARDLQNVDTYINLLEGTGYYPNDRANYRSFFYDNVLEDQRRESIASLTDIRPVVDVSCKVGDYEKQIKPLVNLLGHEWQRTHQVLTLAEMIDHALFGTSFAKVVAYEPGVMEVSAHALGTVIPVQMEGRDLQSSAAVIYRAWKSLGYFYRKFGEKAKGLERYSVRLQTSSTTIGDTYSGYNRPDNIPDYQWSSLSPAMKRHLHLSRSGATEPGRGVYNNEAYPIIPLQEIYAEDWSANEFGHQVLMKNPDLSVQEHNYHYIVQPKGLLYPRKRLVIFGGDLVMYDGPSPFWDGKYPFAMLQLNPCVWAPGGISKYRDLIPLSRSLNKVGAGVEETVMDAVNRNVVSKKGAMDMVSWKRFDPTQPKQKIMLNANANPKTDFVYMDAKTLPAYVEMWLKHIDARIKTRSGALDISGMMRKKQIPGADTVEGIRDSMSGPFRLESGYVEVVIQEIAELEVSRIFQFYTLNQRLRILGEDGKTWEDYDYVANKMVPAFSPKEDHWRLFPMNFKQGSMHGNKEQQKKVVALNLRKTRDISLESLYEILDVGLSAETEIARLQKESKELPQPPARASAKQARTSGTQRKGSPI